MAKPAVTDWDETNANNTDVGGINIDEGCPAPNLNNMGREIMAQIAKVNSGTDPVADTWSFADPSDLTKKARLDAGNVTAGQTRVIYAADADIALTLPVGGSVLAPHEGLVVARASASTVDIDATAILLRTTGGLAHRATSVNLTVDITTSGANGLDASTEATSTGYHLWVIYNPSTTAVAGLLSTSATAPTMPSGYTYKGYVGWAYNDSGGDLVDFSQHGASVACSEQAVKTNGSDPSFTPVTMSAIPPTAWQVTGYWRYLNGSGSQSILSGEIAANSGGAIGRTRFEGLAGNAANQISAFTLNLHTAQTLYYKVTAVTGSSTNIYINGWRY